MNLTYKKEVAALTVAAVIAIATATPHLSCLLLGPSCYAAQMVPPIVEQSAIDGTWLAPITTVVLSLLFISCGLFALSGAGYIAKLPLRNTALVFIAVLCILRGIAIIPSSLLYPDMVSVFSVSAGVVWFITGVLFAYGYVTLYVCKIE